MTDIPKMYKCWCGFKTDERVEMYVHDPAMNTSIELPDGTLRKVHQFEGISSDLINHVITRINKLEQAGK